MASYHARSLSFGAARGATHEQNTRSLCAVPISVTSAQSAITRIVSALQSRRGLCVVFANTHLLYWASRDQRLARSLQRFFILNDGVGVDLLSRLAYRAGFPENLNGTDFVPRLLQAAPPSTRVMLVGARSNVTAAAANTLQNGYPHLQIIDWRDGYDGKKTAPSAIIKSRARLVLVAMGNPIQEQWIAQASQQFPDVVFLGVGAYFDYVAGSAKRAPRILRKLKLEWLYRLAREPSRMWRRYTVEVATLTFQVLRSRIQRGR